MKHATLSLLLLLFIATSAMAQHGSNAYRELADSLYRHHHYQYAANYYEKALKKAPDPAYLMLQLGKCYDKVNKPAVAEQWFSMAMRKRAKFTDEDYYLYAEALIAQQKFQRADSLLEHILTIHPEMVMAHVALNDIRNLDKFYADSSLWRINHLSINTSVAEFSPVRFKDGIVFTSARQEGALKKKYHWDNTHFLNLYYTRKTENTFGTAELFEKGLNTKHHDGPAAFYDNFRRMIVNRNQRVQVAGREEVFEWRPGLFDAVFNAKKSDWEVTPLPFNNHAYSYAHPSITEDGSTLYFSSDMPGGYGGMDLYRAVRTNGVWSAPFNLGPSINTPEDEAFPFFINNTLYFATNGHGGLGGLDIFISTLSTNGFTPPVNAGYPVNSAADDLSFMTDSLQREGYFASARKGNDDIYSFLRIDRRIKLLAHIYDGETKQPLGGASIQVLTNGDADQTLLADDNGDFHFLVPKDISYIVIGTHGDLVGMAADIADTARLHNIPAYRDTTRLACIGLIKNEFGLPQTASVITIIDLTTGQRLQHVPDQSIISFRGEKGHSYNIEAQHASGNKASHRLDIAKNDQGTKRFTIILPTTPAKMEMAARVFKAEDNLPIPGADVKVLTFGEDDQQLATNTEGVVEFNLAQGQAYVVIAQKEGLSGMHSGMAETDMQKGFIIHPVPAYGDKPNSVLGMGLVTTTRGDAVDGFRATVTNKETGENVNVQANRGLLTFLGERGNAYKVKVEHDNFETTYAEVNIPGDGADVQKFAIVMREKAGRKPADNRHIPLLATGGKPSTLLVLDTEEGGSKAFISTDDRFNEISEENGELQVRDGLDVKRLGKGTIAQLKTDPGKVLSDNGFTNVTSVMLRNVYFDFDKSTLDADDMQRLGEVKKVLDNQPSYKLTISGHADDRGNDNYNERLSRRRSAAVAKYLIAQGINKARIIMKAYGESRPAIPCTTGDCSEDDHQMNRRAEFLLQGTGETPAIISAPDARKSLSRSNEQPEVPAAAGFEALLRQCGDKAMDGISFRVNIGAFRKKHDLRFPELAAVGTVESIHRKGITYYFLSSYKTLAAAEHARQQAVEKGISDASISVYRNGDKIPMDEFAALIR